MMSSVFDMCHRIVCLATGVRTPSSGTSSVGIPSPVNQRKPSLTLSNRKYSVIVEEQPSSSGAAASPPSPPPRKKVNEQRVRPDDYDSETESPPDPVCTRPMLAERQSLLSSELSLSGIEPKTDLAKEFIDQLPPDWTPSSSSYDSSEASVRWASVQLTPVIPSVYETPIPAHRTHSYPQLRSGACSEVEASSGQQQAPPVPPHRSLVPRSFSDNAGTKLTIVEDKCLLSLESVLATSISQSRSFSNEDQSVIMRGAHQRRRRLPHGLHAIYENVQSPPQLMQDQAGPPTLSPWQDTTEPESTTIIANDSEQGHRGSEPQDPLLILKPHFLQPSAPANTYDHPELIHESNGPFNQFPSFDSGFKSDRSYALATKDYDDTEDAEDRQGQLGAQKRVVITEYLPDDLAFRTDSACSDHPSLDTTTIDMDLTSRADLDTTISDFAETMSKSIERESITSLFGEHKLPVLTPPIPRKRTSSPSSASLAQQRAIAESASDEAALSRLTNNESTSQLITDSFSMLDSHLCEVGMAESLEISEAGATSLGKEEARQLSSESFLPGQPHYPLAFGSQNTDTEYPVNELDRVKTGAKNGDMATNGIATDFQSSAIRGPTFKATGARPAIWTPGSGASNGSITESKPNYASVELSLPATPSKFIGYSPVPFSTPTNGADDHFLTSSTSALFSPAQTRTGYALEFGKHGADLDTLTSTNGAIPNTQAAVASNASLVSPASPAPPPPPPPPPASTYSKAAVIADKDYEPLPTKSQGETVITDDNRSVVEYPEKQSVASLRSAIESKLNGSAPIKSVSGSPKFGSLQNELAKNRDSPLKSKLEPNIVQSTPAYRPVAVQRQQMYQKPPENSSQSESSSLHLTSKEETVSVANHGLLRDAIDRYKTTPGASAGGTPDTSTPSSASLGLGQGPLPSYIERYKTNTTTTTKISNEPLLNAAKTIDEVTASLMSSLAAFDEPERGNEAKNYATPLSVTTTTIATTTTTTGHGWAPMDRTETPPRPPLPTDMTSPLPPSIPPPPVGFVMQPSPTSVATLSSWTAQQDTDERRSSYGSTADRNGARLKEIGGGEPFSTVPRRTATNEAAVQQRPIDLHSMRTENYYAVGADSKTSTLASGRQHFLKQADYKQETGRKTPSGLKQQGPNADYQHHWYKMMYKKLHHVPKKEDPNPYVVTYKYPDYASEPEDEPEMEVEQPAASVLSYCRTLPTRGTKRYEREAVPARSVRSKSAGRYETASPPPGPPPPPLPQTPAALHSPHGSEVIRSSTPGERYRLQPRSIENYVPGTSSALHYEQEKQRVNTLSTIRPQSAVPFVSYYGRTSGFGGYDFADDSASIQKRRELSPLSREESRYWYHNVQAGGDAPLTGFRQPAPERRDSIFRTAIAAAVWVSGDGYGPKLSNVHGGGSSAPSDRRYRSSSSECTRNAYAQTSRSPRRERLPRRSRSRRPFYGTYWKSAFQSSPEPLKSPLDHIGAKAFAPLDIRIDTDDVMGRAERCHDGVDGVRWSDTRYSFSPPVRSTDPGSKLYAFERSKIKDFHLPFFRLTPPASVNSGCSTGSRSVEFEIEAYFTYLRQFCEAEGAKLEKGVQAGGSDGRPWLEDYDTAVHEQRRLDSEFQRTCDSLREALREIEILASPTRLRWRRTPRRDQDQQSNPDETGGDSTSSTMTRSYSLPNGVGVSHSLKSNDRPEVGQTHSSYAIVKKRRQFPEKYSWVQNGDETADHLAAAEELLASKLSIKAADAGMKRVSSLPQISEHTETTGSRQRASKSIEGLSRLDGPDDKTPAIASSKHQGSQDTTDVSQSMDSMEVVETATTTVTASNSNTVTEKRPEAPINGKKESHTPLKSALKSPQSALDHQSGVPASSNVGSSHSQLDKFSVPSSSFVSTCTASDTRSSASRISSHNQLLHELTGRSRVPLSIFHPFPSERRRWGTGLACMSRSIWTNKRPWVFVNRRSPACSSAAARVANKHKAHSLSKSASLFLDSPPQRFVDSGRIRSTGERLNNYELDDIAKLEKELLLEDERRKKQEKELEDQKARRHGYIPAKSPALGGDDRFAKLISEYTSGGFGRNLTSTPAISGPPQKQTNEFRGVATALYNFVAQSPREISFRKSDLIKIRRQLDDNWYEGEVNGRVGILPVNYVEICATAKNDERAVLTEVNMSSEGQAQVLFGFDGRSGNELPLRKGEFITLIKRIDENWYDGMNSAGRRGIFPANYVKPIKEPFSKTSNFVTAFGGAASPQIYGKSEDSLSKLIINGILYDKKTGPTETSGRDWYPPSHISQPKSFIENGTAASASASGRGFDEPHFHSSSRKEVSSHGTEPLGVALSTSNPETFQALFPYKPQNPDELELRESDIVYVVEKCDDGWYIGTSLRTGRFGTFPGNYVKAV